jgi:prepilin-type processing-associated H-X9-DG protein
MTPPRTSPAAVVSLVLGLLSPLLSLVAAVPAWFVGLRALRAINASDGRLRGRGLAVAGMALGALGVGVTALGILAMVLLRTTAYSHRVVCTNNLRALGLAVHLYREQNAGTFPPATVIAPGLAPQRRLSWFVSVLPYLDRKQPGSNAWEPLLGQFDPSRPWDVPPNAAAVRTRVLSFLCPAGPLLDPGSTPGLTSYVGLAGVDPDAAALPRSDPRAGFFGYDRTLAQTDVTAGISQTMMVAETGQANGPWVAGGPPTVRGVDPGETAYVGPGRPFGGLHPGGANVLRVDGSVEFVGDDVAPQRFRDAARIARPEEGAGP